MNCQDIARMLDEREVDGLLTEEQADVQAHLATCRDCARDWQIHAQLADAVIPAVPAELRALYSPQVGGGVNLGARQRSRFVIVGTLVAVAAAAAMLALQMNTLPAPVVATVDPVQVEPSVIQGLGKVLPSPTEPMPEDQSKEAEAKAAEEWTQRVVGWLAVRDDPDALIAAARLMMDSDSDNDPKIRLLLQRAAAVASESARIQAAAMLMCQALQPCDTTPYEQALRRVAPDNALGWTRELYLASRDDDPEAFRNALTEMSRARTFDIYSHANTLSLISQVRAARVAPPANNGASPPASKELIALRADGIPSPAYQPIQKYCKSATDDRALLQCRQIGAAMRAGDTILTNLVGLTISSYGLPADSAEARSLKQERNLVEWISRKSQEVFNEDDVFSEGELEEFLRPLAVHPREIDSLRAILEEHGIPTEPPADWKP